MFDKLMFFIWFVIVLLFSPVFLALAVIKTIIEFITIGPNAFKGDE